MSDEIQRWLVTEPHRGDEAVLANALAARMAAAGLPVTRMSYALMTMHPEVLWRTVQWRAGDRVVVRDQPHARLDEPFYTRSAVAAVRRSLAPVRVRLGPGELPFPICHDLRDEGCTDYYVQALPFTNRQVSYVSFASDARDGFSDAHLEQLESMRSFVAQRLELESAYYATRALLAVYLGKNASRRVLAGAFQRGHGEVIDAAIWFSDMRGFTELADRTEPARVIEILDAYFDVVASAIDAHGGEVLKLIGDAVLAIFPLAGDARAACRHALAAAEQALASIAGARTIADAPMIGIALHRGPVMYGNIGARDRLDFTVISSSVNEASRLEGLCKTLDAPLVLSAAFTRTAELEDVVDRGEQALKGVKDPVRVFTLR